MRSAAAPRSPRRYFVLKQRIAEGEVTLRYVPDEQTGKLAGVATSNHTLPQKFADLCAGILKYADPLQGGAG